jgi:hypothetical protein
MTNAEREVPTRSHRPHRYEKRFSACVGEAWHNRAPALPLKVCWLQPGDISTAAVFLTSDAAAHATVAEHQVTGGASAKDV